MRRPVLCLLALALLAPAPPVVAGEPAGGSDLEQRLTPEQLKELVGPVALYPDVVLSPLLAASAYPLEVVAAARWRASLPADAQVVEPPAAEAWDPSVKALLQFPDVLAWLDENLEWYGALGRAISTQQQDVLAAVQAFRAEAAKAGNLRSDDKVRVARQEAPPVAEVGAPPADAVAPIVIEPVNPQVVYVPTYDPALVVLPSPRPVISWGFGFSFGTVGLWLHHEIWWPWYRPGYPWWYGSIWYHATPWWWGHPRPPAWGWARPYPWYPGPWRYGPYTGWRVGYRPPPPRPAAWGIGAGHGPPVRYVAGVRVRTTRTMLPGSVRPEYRPMTRTLTRPAPQVGLQPGVTGIRRPAGGSLPATLPTVRSSSWPQGRTRPAILQPSHVPTGAISESVRGRVSLRSVAPRTTTLPAGPAVGIRSTPRTYVPPGAIPSGTRLTTPQTHRGATGTSGALTSPFRGSATQATRNSLRGNSSIRGTRR